MSHFQVALLGIAGAAVPEVMRAIAALRAGSAPNTKELLASGLAVLLGLGVLLFDTDGVSRLQVAVLGAAFPQLFSGLVAVAKPPGDNFRSATAPERGPLDYLAWRL